jgi:hypothetical protein
MRVQKTRKTHFKFSIKETVRDPTCVSAILDEDKAVCFSHICALLVEPHFGQNLIEGLMDFDFRVFSEVPINARHWRPFFFRGFFSSLFFGSLGFFTRSASVTAKTYPP